MIIQFIDGRIDVSHPSVSIVIMNVVKHWLPPNDWLTCCGFLPVLVFLACFVGSWKVF